MAILVVGPGFLASDFITQEELPVILASARDRGTRLYPIVVGYCAYRRSILEPHHSFNDPDAPLEALSAAEQNKLLNALCIAVDEVLRADNPVASNSGGGAPSTKATIDQIESLSRDTRTAFDAQCRRRDQLVETLSRRLGIEQLAEYESFFRAHHADLDGDEKFQFEQIRAITEGQLRDGNQRILRAIEANPQVLGEVKSLVALRQHLVFWLNKYDRVFSKRPDMCVLYTGVEDGVPFPKGVERDLASWKKSHR